MLTIYTCKMADLREPFELCRVFQIGSLIGISKYTGGENVLITFKDRGVLAYNVSNNKVFVRKMSKLSRLYTFFSYKPCKQEFAVEQELNCAYVTVQLQHQKLINSWSLEQRNEVTSAAIHNPADESFLMAVNKTVGNFHVHDHKLMLYYPGFQRIFFSYRY